MAKQLGGKKPVRKPAVKGGAKAGTRGAGARGPRTGATRTQRSGPGRPAAGRSSAGPRTGASRTGASRTGASRTGASRTGAPRTGAPRSSSGPRTGSRVERPRTGARSGSARSTGAGLVKRGERTSSERAPRTAPRVAGPRAAASTGLVKASERGSKPSGGLKLAKDRTDSPRPRRSAESSFDRPRRDAGPKREAGPRRSAGGPRRMSDRPTRSDRPMRGDRPTRSDRPTRAVRPTKGSLSSAPAKKVMIKRKGATAPVEVVERDVLASAIPDTMRLNRFIASSGVTSRRKADELIAGGLVKVNGKTVLEMGVQVKPHEDLIVVDGRVVSIPTKQLYLVMNKPKDYITTAKDEKDRKTVFDLLSTYDRVFNVGRLDRNTTGVLLFTNDGELTNRLTHPSYEVTREYHATLDKPLTTADAKRIAEGGLDIGEGDITGPALVSVADRDPKDVILAIAEGKNREVRRIFESLGYDVEKLDRVSFAGITHKGMTRGEVRPLTRSEVRHLKKIVGIETEGL